MTAATQQRTNVLYGERRSSHRYPIRIAVSYKLRHSGRVIRIGAGRTIDLSSRGVLFDADGSLPAGAKIELCIAWPALLHNDVALNLFVTGQVVRTQETLTAVAFNRYLFRVRSMRKSAVGGDLTLSYLA